MRFRGPEAHARQTWRTFLANHVGTLVAVDFFTGPTVLFKGLFVFVVLTHERRRLVHIDVTDAVLRQNCVRLAWRRSVLLGVAELRKARNSGPELRSGP